MGKNMWKFDFPRGHYFQARDDYGDPYATTWDKLNFSACIQQGSFGQRGEQGMFEALSLRLFNLAGCPASKTNYLHFRIIDELYEDGERNAAHPPLTTKGTQYDGDFWGLYMTIEQMDGRFLDEHGLPDGNLFKMDGAYPGGFDKNNQGPTQPDDNRTCRFRSTSRPISPVVGQNVNLDATAPIRHLPGRSSRRYPERTGSSPSPGDRPVVADPQDLDLTWTTYYGNVSDLQQRIFNNAIDLERTGFGRWWTCSSTGADGRSSTTTRQSSTAPPADFPWSTRTVPCGITTGSWRTPHAAAIARIAAATRPARGGSTRRRWTDGMSGASRAWSR
jgi:hypothetical protein